MAGALKRAVHKVTSGNMDQDWDICLEMILGGYKRQTGTDRKSSFEILFGIKPRFAYEATHYEPVAVNGGLIHVLEIALVKSLRASRLFHTRQRTGRTNLRLGTQYS